MSAAEVALNIEMLVEGYKQMAANPRSTAAERREAVEGAFELGVTEGRIAGQLEMRADLIAAVGRL